MFLKMPERAIVCFPETGLGDFSHPAVESPEKKGSQTNRSRQDHN